MEVADDNMRHNWVFVRYVDVQSQAVSGIYQISATGDSDA